MSRLSSAPSIHPTTADLLEFIDRSPTSYNAVAEVQRRAHAAGFQPLDEGQPWSLEEGKGYTVARAGGIIAFRMGTEDPVEAGFRLIGAHTDSPNLRLKPNPTYTKEGYLQLGVEVYGGVLTYTWLDRDLGLAGRVLLQGDSAAEQEERLLHIARPLLRVPALAIHLDRDVIRKGLVLNAQNHLPPLLALMQDPPEGGLPALLGEELGVDPDRILSWDLSLTDVQPSAVGGLNGEFVFAPRLDNLASCHSALTALLRAPAAAATQLVCLFDHEEVGSASFSGAGGSLAEDVLERILAAADAGADRLARAIARSWQISADMAHAIHPNYPERHEPQHAPKLNGGPVIKINTQQRYATDGRGEALFENLCKEAGVPCQKFVVRTDMACGSTIGPISSTRLGIRTVDVGNALLSMHSIREMTGSEDPERMTEVMTRFLQV